MHNSWLKTDQKELKQFAEGTCNKKMFGYFSNT